MLRPPPAPPPDRPYLRTRRPFSDCLKPPKEWAREHWPRYTHGICQFLQPRMSTKSWLANPTPHNAPQYPGARQYPHECRRIRPPAFVPPARPDRSLHPSRGTNGTTRPRPSTKWASSRAARARKLQGHILPMRTSALHFELALWRCP